MFDINLKFSDRGSAALSSILRTRLLDFIGDKDINLFGRIHFTGSDVKPCGDAHRKVKYQPGLRNPGNHKGFPVSIWTEGRQGVRGFLWCEHTAAYSSLEKLVKSGKVRGKVDTSEKVIQLTQKPVVVLSPSSSEPVITDEVLKVEPVVISLQASTLPNPEIIQKKVSPLEKLTLNGVSSGEIERLKKTLALIIFRVHGRCEEIPCTLRVPVSIISSVAKSHMNLVKDSRGQDRGPMANFYSAKVVLFAVKYHDDHPSQNQAKHHDWLFDCDSILAFIGGIEKFKTLTADDYVSANDLSLPPQQEMSALQLCTVAESSDVVVKISNVADEDVLRFALESIAAQKKAAHFLEELKGKESELFVRVNALRTSLTSLEQELSTATSLREDAEVAVTKLSLSEDELTKIRAAQARLKTLLDDVNL